MYFFLLKKNFICCSPENVPRLFDLVRISDERVRPVFYFALRDTLVAKDVDQASRICYQGKRHRVVALSGEVFETFGNTCFFLKPFSTSLLTHHFFNHLITF